MSVNLHLSVKVSGYDPSRISEIKQAIQTIFDREDIGNDMSSIEEFSDGPTRTLSSRSNPDYPVIISSSYKWIPEVQNALSQAVAEANGGPCEVQFQGDDADEGVDDDEEDDSE
ncbi:MAG: hypothetical protein R3B84_10125 [Zavarzinella sp.]